MTEKCKKESSYDAFVTQYKNIPSIFVFRTLEYAETLGDAFDVMQDYTESKKTLFWDDKTKKWSESNF